VSRQLEPQQQEHRLFSLPEISVTDYRCRVACHPVGPEELLDAHGIVFVRSDAPLTPV
jgi:hypothetical protein